ncbi:hypothetical protein PG996_013880 [Apiospora saccharicola]|uniref:Integral membrane protein n=1 Tax=Apiospora saccharicola TaxID=335842 RepID=A0ABR1TIM4_9PEZI
MRAFTFAFLPLLLLPRFSSQETGNNAPGGCHLKSDWVKQLLRGDFDATQNCEDLNFVLQAVNKDKSLDFCSADPKHVFGYIREGFRPNLETGRRIPEDCEIEQWWYRGRYPKSPVAFCKNATAIAVALDRGNKTHLTHAQPYYTVVHSSRAKCHNLLREDLTTIGNPDVAGPGVMASYLIQLLLCAFFCIFYRKRGPRRAEKSFAAFYTTTMIMAISIAIAAAVTFAEKRAAPSTVRSDLRLPNIYEYRLLALAPALAVLPVMVAHSLHLERHGAVLNILGSRRRRLRQLLLSRVLTVLVCVLCAVVVWVVWVVGEQGRRTSPVRFDFGGRFSVRVSGFLYGQAGEYALAVACVTTVLPFLGALALGVTHDWVRLRKASLVFRVFCITLALVEWVMLMYIRTKAIEDGQGHTSETEIGFGQILALFTWFPVLFILGVGVEFPGVDDAKI